MNRIDREILGELVNDGRRSYTAIGESVHLSANAVAERVRRLMDSGVIRAIAAVVDPAAMGYHLQVHVAVKLRQGVRADDFEAALRFIPQVGSAALMTGQFDYLLRVACRDRDELVTVTEALRHEAGAAETECRLILREIVVNPLLP